MSFPLRASPRGLLPPLPAHQQVPGGPLRGRGQQALEVLWGGCCLLLPTGLRYPETHFFFKLLDHYFTIWCWFLPHISMDRPCVSHALPLEPPSPLGCTEPCVSSLSHRAHSRVVCFTRAGVRISMLLSPFVPASPSLTVSTSLFSVSASPLLPCK